MASAVAGCYSYRSLTNATVVPGTPVRLFLSDSGSFGLADYLGRDVVALDGDFVERGAGGISLSIRSAQMRNGSSVDWRGERVTIPSMFVASLQERKLSPARSVLLGGAIAGFAVIVERAMSGGGIGSGGSRSPPGPAQR